MSRLFAKRKNSGIIFFLLLAVFLLVGDFFLYSLFTVDTALISAIAIWDALIFLVVWLLYERMHKEIRRSLLGEMFDHAPAGMFTVSKEGTIEICNAKMAQLANMKGPEELVGKKVYDIARFHRMGLDESFRRALEGKEFEREVSFELSKGRYVYRHYQGVPIYRPSGKAVEGLLVMVEDIAKQKELEFKLERYSKDLEQLVADRTKVSEEKVEELKATEKAMLNILEDVRSLEQNLKEERDRAQAVISSMGEGLLLVDERMKVILVNQKASSLLRCAPDDVMGRSIDEVLSVVRQKKKEMFDIKSTLREVVLQAEVLRYGVVDDLYCQVKDSRGFPVAFLITPFEGENLKGAVIVFQDISEEKALDQAKTEFISTASHQLRTPLTSIRWNIEMLNNGDLGTLSAQQKEVVEQIYIGSLHLNEIIQLLLSMARLESGRTVINPENIDVRSFVNGMVKELEPLKNHKKITTTVDVPKEISTITFDAAQLRQVLGNLISNAYRYTDQGNVNINLFDKTDSILFEVADTGMGIPKDQENKIFQKFFRATNAVGKVSDGSGLGLSLARVLVETWGGKIWFISREGQGTTFYFTVPKEQK